MASERRKVWLNMYGGGFISKPFSTKQMADAFAGDDRIVAAVQVDLIRTADGWKQDDTAARIVGAKIMFDEVIRFLGMTTNQREYSWHDVMDALESGKRKAEAQHGK